MVGVAHPHSRQHFLALGLHVLGHQSQRVGALLHQVMQPLDVEAAFPVVPCSIQFACFCVVEADVRHAGQVHECREGNCLGLAIEPCLDERRRVLAGRFSQHLPIIIEHAPSHVLLCGIDNGRQESQGHNRPGHQRERSCHAFLAQSNQRTPEYMQPERDPPLRADAGPVQVAVISSVHRPTPGAVVRIWRLPPLRVSGR